MFLGWVDEKQFFGFLHINDHFVFQCPFFNIIKFVRFSLLLEHIKQQKRRKAALHSRMRARKVDRRFFHIQELPQLGLHAHVNRISCTACKYRMAVAQQAWTMQCLWWLSFYCNVVGDRCRTGFVFRRQKRLRSHRLRRRFRQNEHSGRHQYERYDEVLCVLSFKRQYSRVTSN